MGLASARLLHGVLALLGSLSLGLQPRGKWKWQERKSRTVKGEKGMGGCVWGGLAKGPAGLWAWKNLRRRDKEPLVSLPCQHPSAEAASHCLLHTCLVPALLPEHHS